MKGKLTSLIILIASILALAFHFNAIADIDAPHSKSNMTCDGCHGYEIFWVGTGSYDALCQQCHKTGSSCPYVDTNGPAVWTHKDSDENALAECRTCHDPHEHKQKLYKNTDADTLFLARGEITNYGNNGDGTSTLNYSSITYKDGWDATKLTGKTEDCRRTILFPNVNKLGYSYPILAVDEVGKTITVKGDVSPAYEYISPPSSFAAMYGQYIKDTFNKLPVKFFDRTGQNSFGFNEFAPDIDQTPYGICQVCHTDEANPDNPTHWRADGTGTDHYNGNTYEEGCIHCHSHVCGFVHGCEGGGTECIECHGHDEGYEYSTDLFSQGKGTYISHSTHTENDDSDEVKGPFLTCGACHNTNKFPFFRSKADADATLTLSQTDICDDCHSPRGTFDGVDDLVIGAKNTWKDDETGKQGVYQDNILRVGKEKWCAGCHDDEPSVVNYATAPDICGDNSSYGYYLGAHGNTGYGVNRNGVSYSQGECVHCHDVSVAGTEPPLRIINESFETSPGYDETWGITEDGGTLNPDSDIPDTNPPPSAGSECLQSTTTGLNYQAYVTLDYDNEEEITFTRFYLYVEEEFLDNGDNKNIGALKNSTNNNVFIFRLNKNGTQLRFNLILYNDGSFKYYFADIFLNTWYRIEVKYNNINDSWAWRLDGTTKDKGRLKGDHRNGIKKWNFGFMTSSLEETGTVYYDLIAVKTDDWVGEEQSATGIPLHGGQLFADNNPASQTDNFCFQCHKGAGSVQNGGITNYTYSKNFGGGSQTFNTIYDAFNPSTGDTPSSHNLSDVLNHAESRDIGFTSNTNACIICHDPHYAQRNYPVTSSGKGGVKTAIRRPSDYTTNPINLWGDENAATSGRDERMSDYTDDYQSPYFVGIDDNYEPANDDTYDGSNLPNFKDFCNNCHGDTDVYSTEHSKNLEQIDWASKDLHGISHKDIEGLGYTTDPYGGGETDNYVLSCTDCHEPHGSQNEWLLRTTANGTDNISVPNTDTGRWLYFCTTCHVLTNHEPPYQYDHTCSYCHYHNF